MLLKELVDRDKPFVIFKKPGSGKVNVWKQNNTQLYTSTDLFVPGFYFAPFDFDNHPVIVFPESKTKIFDIMLKDLEQDNTESIDLSKADIQEAEVVEYQEKVKEAVDLIRSEQLQKIVLSRSIKVHFESFDIFSAVIRLMWSYEHAYVYLWYHPKIGTWIGATPELLAGYQNGLLKTVSLAGTVTDINEKEKFARKDSLFREDEMPDSWGGKEFNEQQIVTDYIVNSLKKFSKDITVENPETIRQGHLEHIKTRISAQIDKENLSRVIRQLHPTPAVCGLPADTAKQYIKQIEDYDRKYYTGFLGEKSQETVELYVNLRCMEVLKNHFKLYVGGGIVSDSQPGKEWQEILLKSKVLILGFNN